MVIEARTHCMCNWRPNEVSTNTSTKAFGSAQEQSFMFCECSITTVKWQMKFGSVLLKNETMWIIPSSWSCLRMWKYCRVACKSYRKKNKNPNRTIENKQIKKQHIARFVGGVVCAWRSLCMYYMGNVSALSTTRVWVDTAAARTQTHTILLSITSHALLLMVWIHVVNGTVLSIASHITGDELFSCSESVCFCCSRRKVM